MAFAVRLKPSVPGSLLLLRRDAPSLVLDSGAWNAVDVTEAYEPDPAFRYDVNRAYRSAKLEVTDAPAGFPDWTDLGSPLPTHLLVGSGTPDVGDGGENLQLYVDLDDGELFQHQAGSWVDLSVQVDLA